MNKNNFRKNWIKTILNLSIYYFSHIYVFTVKPVKTSDSGCSDNHVAIIIIIIIIMWLPLNGIFSLEVHWALFLWTHVLK